MMITVWRPNLQRTETVEAHRSITQARIMEAYERWLTTLDNPGFCLHCGEEAMGCEPDAQGYQCEACDQDEVYGAAELLLSVA